MADSDARFFSPLKLSEKQSLQPGSVQLQTQECLQEGIPGGPELSCCSYRQDRTPGTVLCRA